MQIMFRSVSVFVVGNSVEEGIVHLGDIGMQLMFYPRVVVDSFSDYGVLRFSPTRLAFLELTGSLGPKPEGDY